MGYFLVLLLGFSSGYGFGFVRARKRADLL
jgi:hypothetical protein